MSQERCCTSTQVLTTGSGNAASSVKTRQEHERGVYAIAADGEVLEFDDAETDLAGFVM